jgi:hypothetical protein
VSEAAARPGTPRGIQIHFREEWAGPRGKGLLAPDPRVKTLRKVLVTYPEVRHILPDRISLEPGTDARVLDTVVGFLQRQHWLVKSVAVE